MVALDCSWMVLDDVVKARPPRSRFGANLGVTLVWACAQMASACSLVALVFLGVPGLLLEGPG